MVGKDIKPDQVLNKIINKSQVRQNTGRLIEKEANFFTDNKKILDFKIRTVSKNEVTLDENLTNIGKDKKKKKKQQLIT